MNIKASKKKILKGITNGGDLAKQVYYLIGKEGSDTTLVIRKRVLTKNPAIFVKNYHNIIYRFKNLFLVETVFTTKVETLDFISAFVNEEIANFK